MLPRDRCLLGWPDEVVAGGCRWWLRRQLRSWWVVPRPWSARASPPASHVPWQRPDRQSCRHLLPRTPRASSPGRTCRRPIRPTRSRHLRQRRRWPGFAGPRTSPPQPIRRNVVAAEPSGAEAAQPLDDCLSARWAHLWVHRLPGRLPPGDRSRAVLGRLFRRLAGRPGTWELRGDRPRLVRAVRRAGTAHHRHVPGRACAGARRGADRPGLDPRPWLRPVKDGVVATRLGARPPEPATDPISFADSVAVRAVIRRSRNAASLHRHPGPPGDGGRRSPVLPELPPGLGHGAQGPAQAQLRGSAPRDSGRRGDLRDAAHGSRHDSTGQMTLTWFLGLPGDASAAAPLSVTAAAPDRCAGPGSCAGSAAPP